MAAHEPSSTAPSATGEQPAAKRMKTHLRRVAHGDGSTPIAERILSSNRFAQGVPADDKTCMSMIEFLTMGAARNSNTRDSFLRSEHAGRTVVAGENCHVVDFSGDYFAALSRGNDHLHARFFAKMGQGERLVGELHTASTCDGIRELLGSTAQMVRTLSTDGLCASCPRPEKAFCRVPREARCARCSLVRFLQCDDAKLTDATCSALYSTLVSMHSEEMPYAEDYDDAAEPSPLAGVSRPMCVEQIHCLTVAVAACADVTIEFTTDAGETAFVAQFIGWCLDEDQEYEPFGFTIEGEHSRPGTTQGLRELLVVVRAFARDFRRRGFCPKRCGYDSLPRLLTAEFCARCCLEAAVCGRLPA